jgi:DinB superfamily
MHQNLPQSVALLSSTPATLNALLRDLPDGWTMHNEGGETFTVPDVLGHLIYGDRVDWLARTHMILEHGETRPFEPFDRRGHVKEREGKTLPQLLDEFARVRASALDELRALNLQPAQLALRGCHPTFGVVTLSQLLSTWAAHDLTHIHQISRIMAHQYREAVGPWSKFLGVLHCNGHSA